MMKYLSVLVVFIGVAAIGSCGNDKRSKSKTNKIREDSIPDNAAKITPAMDLFVPVVHDNAWEAPVPMRGPVNTAGAEDSAFITPDGNRFFFFFTPDVKVPPNVQLFDNVTGVWWCHLKSGSWTNPERINLWTELHLDGAEFVMDNILWIASIRVGNLGEIDYYIAEFLDGEWCNPVNAGPALNETYDIGEMHISANGSTIYFHWDCSSVFGGRDLWTSENTGGTWSAPVNMGAPVNTSSDDGYPFVTQDGTELWFTHDSAMGYTGPAVWRSVKSGGTWGEPEEIISNFAGEPTLDNEGNIYFTHHFFDSGLNMIEADIYVCYKKAP